ncbi:MAG: hypothetical protein CSA81_10535 [Acidobacteria bacterium]|nr:MAG: hypothetical protein CSA81_10535 [Acidobacteriota bacterium]
MKTKSIITLVLLALCGLFLTHFLYNKTRGARLDFTADNLYSLTNGTHEILEKMRSEGVKPVDVTLYFSEDTGKKLPQFIKNFISYADYVRSLLGEYERYSDGKILFHYVDPVTDTDEAQDAADDGLEGKPINQHGDMFYFGIVFKTQTGSKAVIPFLWPEKQETLEYEISKTLYRLLWPKKKRIGIISSLEVLTDNNPYYQQLMAYQGKQAKDSWISMKLMEEEYDLSRIDKESDHISHDEYDLVMVVHPRSLSTKQLWALDEWIVTGGNALIFLDPYCLQDQAPQDPQNPMAAYNYKPSSNLKKLMDKWGIKREEDEFIADYNLAVKRPVQQNGPAQKVIVDLQVTQDSRDAVFDKDSPIFKGVNTVRFFTAGSLTVTDEEKAEFTPLVTMTSDAGLLKVKPGLPYGGDPNELKYLDFNRPGKLMDNYSSAGKPVVMSYLIQGKLDSAFPEGAEFAASTPEPPAGLPPGVELPPEEGAEMVKKEAVAEDARAESVVLIFADVDFISDIFAYQKTFLGTVANGDNHKVLLNSLDFLMGAKELMDVRAKATIKRPFKRFDAIEAQADKETLDREKQIRADIERFQKEVRDKQSQATKQNASLLQKKVRDDVNQINEKIRNAEKELYEIRKNKRSRLEGEETMVKAITMWMMPLLVLAMGLFLFFRRRAKDYRVKGGVA